MIPLSTTTITVLRHPDDEPGVGEDYLDPYDPQPEREQAASGVRAHISSPSGREQVAGASQEVIDFRLDCDPIDVGLKNTDQVLDDTTGFLFEVVWAFPRIGLGLDHIEAGLRTIKGVV